MKMLLAIVLMYVTVSFADVQFSNGSTCYGGDRIDITYNMHRQKIETCYKDIRECGYKPMYNNPNPTITCHNLPNINRYQPAYWYEVKYGTHCTITATTPNGYKKSIYYFCNMARETNIEWRRNYKIEVCREEAEKLSLKNTKIYNHLDKCVDYTTINYGSVTDTNVPCGKTISYMNDTAPRPSTCNITATWSKDSTFAGYK